jgi:ABC-type nickel/cobalt efflux system permease component RcnA
VVPESDQPESKPPPASSEQADAVVPVTVGTVAWAVALVVMLPFHARMKAAGTDWWIWVCVTGLVFGLLGCWWVRRRRSAYRRAGAASDSAPSSAPDRPAGTGSA